MLANETYKFRNYLHEQGIIFCYSGYMTEEVLTGIGNAIKRKLELGDTDHGTAKTVFAIFVEQVQNVIRYSAEKEPPTSSNESNESNELRYGVLTVGYKDGNHFIACGNLVEAGDVERLNRALTNIQNLDKEGLKVLYKQTLRGMTPKGSKGAGVGFIDIARRATHGFEFDFTELDDKHSYFCLKAYV